MARDKALGAEHRIGGGGGAGAGCGDGGGGADAGGGRHGAGGFYCEGDDDDCESEYCGTYDKARDHEPA